ncbi:MAG TPA: hypothetical protein VD788_16210, partial [Candidatus Polarisedimenticolaceae bacterium]|nr:hypothetical protein [Candidatus Polarisedimenticolaceae bacterium]
VRLRDGRVEVRSAERNWTVGQGAELRVRPDGTETHGAIPSHGVEWDWTLGVTPVPDFGGEPMSAFLAWVARERGWSIAYADAMTERSADSSILRGSLALLRVDEALEAAMTATGLRYRIDRGTMVVSRTDPERR